MKQTGNVLILIIIVAILAIGAVIYYKSNSSQPESTKSAEQAKTIQSKNLKFSVEIPSDFEKQEKFTTVILNNNGNEIKISRVATNFENLENYLADLSNKNKFNLSNKENLSINDSVAIRGNTNDEKIYFIYRDGWVFSISTDSNSLFDDLDQIAHSFHYIP